MWIEYTVQLVDVAFVSIATWVRVHAVVKPSRSVHRHRE